MAVNPDTIPRYEIPEQVYAVYDEEPPMGSCWNCTHMVEVKLRGMRYMLCAIERDVSASGDLSVCEADTRDCEDWQDYEL